VFRVVPWRPMDSRGRRFKSCPHLVKPQVDSVSRVATNPVGIPVSIVSADMARVERLSEPTCEDQRRPARVGGRTTLPLTQRSTTRVLLTWRYRSDCTLPLLAGENIPTLSGFSVCLWDPPPVPLRHTGTGPNARRPGGRSAR
jgi:hypothetical protein